MNYETKSDDYLCNKREKLLDFLETGMRESYIKKLHDLLEIERELTLRENQ